MNIPLSVTESSVIMTLHITRRLVSLGLSLVLSEEAGRLPSRLFLEFIFRVIP